MMLSLYTVKSPLQTHKYSEVLTVCKVFDLYVINFESGALVLDLINNICSSMYTHFSQLHRGLRGFRKKRNLPVHLAVSL